MVQEYSRADVKKHDNNQSAWIVVHNSVYDVTPFLNEHPGGEEVLLEQAGKDASEAFEDVGHSSDARELMLKYKVGEVIESEKTAVKVSSNSWASGDENAPKNETNFKSWILPVALGILASLIYRYYQSTH